MKIAVAGATGRVGRHVTNVLDERGHEVVPISRGHGVDVITGEGLHTALTGVQTIVDAATGPSPEKGAATAFFVTAADNLHSAGSQAGVGHMVVVSIIGLDHLGGGYSAAKLAHERAALAGPIPTRILRAAQFHEFVEQLMRWGRRADAIYVPEMRTQLVAARTVAEALADLAAGPDSEFAPERLVAPFAEIAGPREERLVEAARLLAARRGDPARIEESRNPDDPDADPTASGALLPGPHATLAGPTFAQWLDSMT
jgi:uncharacterized protein YbjT (DUF2867 family)